MADEDSASPTDSEQQYEQDEEQRQNEEDPDAENPSSDSDSDYSDYSDSDEGETLTYTRPGDEPLDSNNTPEMNIKRFARVLDSKRMKKQQEEEDRNYVYHEDLFDFPKDPENWREEDLQELWADAPLESTKPGWDPVWADEEDWDIVRDEIEAGRDPPYAPFYIPYRKPYPPIPDNHHDISNPKAVIEELDRIEEFLTWVSYIFADGSSYEGTVWDDLAHGKGVYVAEQGLVRYEGEWLQNNMEGHGVVEVDIPDAEPVPGSKLEAKMRAEGKIINRDYMTPEDREWLEMDIEDSIHLADGKWEVPFFENDEWIRQFGRKPEKGRYRYAGQWKHGRMHGCGVYEVNERTIYGRFYFGELLQDSTGCDEDICALHMGIAEVAAAKARMFINKPDGMVREQRGPYSDPQHPYFYEEEDVWMAPGFINQFYEVPDFWKTYVQEVDQEREMWLNSFYKAPLRLPMPSELEYWWSKEEDPEFVLLNKEPEPDPEDPSKLIYTEDPVILHTPTGRIINYVEDEKYGIRLFWQPPLKDGEEVDPEKAQFLPLGFDEFFGREVAVKKENIWMRLVLAVENACKPLFDKLEKWTEEKKKASEMKMKLIEKELELVEAELCLEEALEDMDEELKRSEKEEEKKVEMGLQEEEDTSALPNQFETSTVEEEEKKEEEDDEEEEEEEEDDDDEELEEDDKAEKDPPTAEGTETREQDDDSPSNAEEPTDLERLPDANVNPKTPSIEEEHGKSKIAKTEKDQSETANSQEKTLKKPDKILPCPRCNSMDTKFCYYNNYNVNQPRHFCKACQRYWTAGGTMRNVPVGAGRRKNKNSTSHYRQITISEALQAARVDAPNGTHQPSYKSNGRVLSFGIDAPICDSMASVLNLADNKVLNGTRNGLHSFEEQRIPVPGKRGENGDDSTSGSTITVSNSMEEGGKHFPREPFAQSINGFPHQIPCLPGVPWPYPWNSAVPPPAFCPPGFPMSFYPAAYWNCGVPGTWSIPWLSPQSPSNQKSPSSNPNSPTLGKHSREGDMLKPDNLEKEESPKQKNGCVLVPKTLRIDDPSEAAKSSIWTTLGIKNESISKGGMFKAFQSKVEEKNHISKHSPALLANPAALSRSLNFHESS